MNFFSFFKFPNKNKKRRVVLLLLSCDEVCAVSLSESGGVAEISTRTVEEVFQPSRQNSQHKHENWAVFCSLWDLTGFFLLFSVSISLPLFFTLTLRHACHNHRVSSKRLPYFLKKSLLITLKLAFIRIFVHASFLFFEDEMHCSRVATRRIW